MRWAAAVAPQASLLIYSERLLPIQFQSRNSCHRLCKHHGGAGPQACTPEALDMQHAIPCTIVSHAAHADQVTCFCVQVSMRPLGSMEFSATCSTLADLGLINMSTQGTQGERFRRMTLQAPRTDALLGLKNARIAQDALSYASQPPQRSILGSPPPILSCQSKLKAAASAG